MWSTTYTLRSETTSTKSMMRSASHSIGSSVYEAEAKCRSLRMKWVAVADAEGNLRPQMRWRFK